MNYLERHMAPDHKSDGEFKARCRCIKWRDDQPCCLLRDKPKAHGYLRDDNGEYFAFHVAGPKP